ncbi:NAD(P)H-dependent oxidoreductase [Ruminococcus sp.]|uniref:flavodoxin family protein n=1 Tax=Ruminococcus sp. TaxID=41978 RepID=UPI0025E956A6|nr:NAD(P)H-dependent oxidoreductase [Ruminococcus sp.]MCR4638158.1 NAD(P)H-dependent oxidoreductase [Ruminococcus sp.]
MKVLIISGTDHKGSSYSIVRIMAEKLTKPENISEVFLPRDFDEFCCGCTSCFTKGEDKCPHAAKLSPITELIDSSEVIILTSPVYVYHCTGQMKALLDHYGWRWMAHRPEEKMFSKQAVVVSTAAGAGVKSTMKDMADSCFFWGIPQTYRLGRAVAATDWQSVKPKIKDSINAKADSIAKKILKRQGKVPISLKTKGFFKIMSLMQRNGWNKTDADYWKEKGWTESKRPWK